MLRPSGRMTEHPRFDEVRRRVHRNPASIAFARLADEYRRAGLYDEAIETCRLGLARHPAYLSPRVTLGLALLAIGQHDAARAELTQVLRAAPDNLEAIRALAELDERAPAVLRAITTPAAPSGTRPPHPALRALECFLAAIVRARQGAGARRPPMAGDR